MSVNTEQVLNVILEEGDCLYIPRGFIHAGDAIDEGSIHLTLAISPTPWANILRLAVEAATHSEGFREAVPPCFMHANDATVFRQKLAGLQMPAIESLRPRSTATVTNNLAAALGASLRRVAHNLQRRSLKSVFVLALPDWQGAI